MKPPQNESDSLARWSGHVLRQLPERPAPPGLALQVFAEIRRRANLPWHQRPWLSWPTPHRWLSALALVVLLIAVFGVGIPSLEDSASQSIVGQRANLAFDYLGAFQSIATSIGRSVRLVLAHVSANTLTLGFASMLAAWLSTLGLGALCWRATLQTR